MTSLALQRLDPPQPPALRLSGDTLRAALRPGHLHELALLELARAGTARNVLAKTQFIQSGRPADALWLLAQGTVCMGSHDADQHWRQTRTIHPGSWIDAESVWLGGPYLESAIAQTDVLAYRFPVGAVEQAVMVRPEIARPLLAVVADRVRRVSGDAHDLLSKSVLARCAGWLIDELQSSEQAAAVLLRQRKQSIASQLGTSPETFSRVLRRLCELRVIEMDRYCIHIRDAQALQRLSSGTDQP